MGPGPHEPLLTVSSLEYRVAEGVQVVVDQPAQDRLVVNKIVSTPPATFTIDPS